MVIDPFASKDEALKEYDIELSSIDSVYEADCIILAVAHDEYKNLPLSKLLSYFKNTENENKVLIDVKGLYSIKDLDESGVCYWRL